MKTRITLIFTLSLLLIVWGSCTRHETETPPVYIAVSKASEPGDFGNYGKWIKKADSTVVLIDVYYIPADSAMKVLETCSGLLLTGGGDVHPSRYGSTSDTSIFEDISLKRDALELELIRRALQLGLPVLGICRGLQIINVSQGGTLYADLPTETDTMVKHRCDDYLNCRHEVIIQEESLLHKTSSVATGIVNSNHHQGIRELAPGLQAIARANDSLTEAIQWKNPEQKPFLLAVQWHPERMDISSPLSLPIAMYFLREAKYYSVKDKE
ncbi:MAG: gamma-glutamyl-gamma-aminobutyrate hydrolase family protein [Bacteroidetes bacterium]|nr:gamma-glutamyl-gamma-aminobutyrate hydrolase family protein [Bacteroidota bacterium]